MTAAKEMRSADTHIRQYSSGLCKHAQQAKGGYRLGQPPGGAPDQWHNLLRAHSKNVLHATSANEVAADGSTRGTGSSVGFLTMIQTG